MDKGMGKKCHKTIKIVVCLMGMLSIQLVLVSSVVFSQNVSGTVVDAQSEETLPGVNVMIKGTTLGTSTDTEGRFELTVESLQDTLVLSFVGYQTQEVPINGRTEIEVTLQQETIAGEELVVVGYGTQERKDVTGSISSFDLEESPVADLPNTNVLSALKGKVSGLNIGPVNSAGDQPSILIRGQNSIDASNSPLIVLDGVIYQGNLSDINLHNIASIDVLKDASATAVYGSRAANGVIVLTSKEGKQGKPTIRLDISQGVNIWQQKPDLMGPQEYLKARMDRTRVDNPLDIPELKVPEEENYEAGRTVDWLDLGTRAGPIQNYQLSVSGAGDDVSYFVSSGYNKEEGVMVGDQFEKLSLTAKVDADITEWLKMGVDGRYSYRTNEGIEVNKQLLLQTSPYGNVYVEGWMDGNVLEKYPTGESRVNPLWGTQGTVDQQQDLNNFRFLGYTDVEIPFIEGLSYRLNYSANLKTNNTGRLNKPQYYVDEGYGTTPPEERYGAQALQEKLAFVSGNKVERSTNGYLIDNIITYQNQFDYHDLGVTLVATRDYSYNETVTINGSDFSALGNVNLGVNGLHNAEIKQFDNSIVESSNIGYLARLSYSYADKYHLTASFRRDGSSVFGEDKKWGNFPSVGIAWTVSEEEFLQSSNVVDYLKLKASYGENGNQAIAPYATQTTVSAGRTSGYRYEFGDNPSNILYGTAISSLGNSTLGWEITSAFNVGFESYLIDNRISLDVNYYFSKTTDQLFVRRIPIMTGFSNIRSSLGQVNNRGVELTLKTTNIENEIFSWISDVTFWRNRNVLKELYGDGRDDIANGLFIGKSLGAIYGYEKAGIVQENDTEYMENTGADPGDVKFKDISGPEGEPDGNITAEYDRKILGYEKPNFRLNFSNTLNYKNLRFYALIQGVFGGGKNNFYVLNNPYAYMMSQQPALNQLDHPYWTPENQNNTYPSTRYFDNRFQGLQSRGFVRIQDITLSYNFTNHSWMKNVNINSLRLNAGIQNLYTFSNWVGGDPEEGERAMTGTYPVPSIYSVGLDISF